MKKILVIVLAIILALSLSLTSVIFAAGGKKEVTLAQEAGQAWLDSTVALTGEPLGWLGADLTTPQVCYGLDGRPSAYMFAMENNGQVVGYIIVGSSAYGYPMFEAADGSPPSIPSADEVKSTLERDLGLKVAKIGNPTRLLYLGFDNLFAVYQAGRQEVAVNLAFDFAVPASNLTAAMPSPEEYKANKEATEQAKPEELVSSISTAQSISDGYNALAVHSWCAWCSCSLNWACYCGPASGGSISNYYKDNRGYTGLPTGCNLYCDLYDFMEADANNGGVWPWDYGPGFVEMAQQPDNGGYNNFRYYTQICPGSEFYWSIRDYINWGYPTAMSATRFWEDVGVPPAPDWPPKKSHFVTIKGYQNPYGSTAHAVLCVDASHETLWLDWDNTGLFRCTCTIWTA